ncbi:MAG: hypothetical protein JWO03_1203 [Bacteroidetes bacterium]|nr:hypothetical protein [Bacteroidota bacterium]
MSYLHEETKPYMKRTLSILILFFVLTSTLCYAQEKAAPVFVKRSEPLIHASGWKTNKSTEKLVANDNLISDQTATMSDSAIYGATPQNLIWMRTASLKYAGRKYYAFYYHYLGGAYKYPDTKVGWASYTATRFVVVDSVQYAEFKKNVLQKRGYVISARSKMSDEIKGPYDEAKLLRAISEAMENKTSVLYYCFTAKTQTLDGREIARFRLPETCANNKDLPNEYFECGYDDFKKMLVD